MSTKPEFGRKITPEPKPLILVQKPTEPKSYIERRLEIDRLPQFKGVKLIFNAGSAYFDGVLKELSKSGARIETSQPHHVPDVFTVKTNVEGVDAKCHRIWSDNKSIGVKFCT